MFMSNFNALRVIAPYTSDFLIMYYNIFYGSSYCWGKIIAWEKKVRLGGGVLGLNPKICCCLLAEKHKLQLMSQTFTKHPHI